jgi:competence protein ComEA
MDKKLKSIIIFTILAILTISGIIYNSSMNLGKDVYVVSPKEDKEGDDIEANNKVTEKNSNDNIDYNEVKNNETKDIKVYISGEVKSPGVVSINNNDRLIDAVDKLGGLTSNADLNRVNLALKIEDGNHYIIPKIGEEINIDYVNTTQNINNNSNNNSNNSLEVNNNSSSKININTASESELDSLPGIGEVTAQKIIDYRNENGKFSTIEDIKNVKGIGDNKFDDIKDSITVQ